MNKVTCAVLNPKMLLMMLVRVLERKQDLMVLATEEYVFSENLHVFRGLNTIRKMLSKVPRKRQHSLTTNEHEDIYLQDQDSVGTKDIISAQDTAGKLNTEHVTDPMRPTATSTTRKAL